MIIIHMIRLKIKPILCNTDHRERLYREMQRHSAGSHEMGTPSNQITLARICKSNTVFWIKTSFWSLFVHGFGSRICGSRCTDIDFAKCKITSGSG